MDTHNIDICPIERYGYALKSVRDISRICEEEMRESNHMRDITHLYPILTYGPNLVASAPADDTPPIPSAVGYQRAQSGIQRHFFQSSVGYKKFEHVSAGHDIAICASTRQNSG